MEINLPIKAQMLVDILNFNQSYGLTFSIDKIIQNLNTLKKDFLFDEDRLPPDKIEASAFQLGRYIVVIQSQPGQTVTKMHFFNFEIEAVAVQLKLLLGSTFSDELAKRWLQIQYEMSFNSNDWEDNIELMR